MPKQTAKYRAAREVGNTFGIPANVEAEALYDKLREAGYDWDSRMQVWNKMPAPNPPSRLIRLRVWADGEVVEDIADDLVRFLGAHGLQCDERSAAYPCRPPQQLESRIYLTFSGKALRPGGKG